MVNIDYKKLQQRIVTAVSLLAMLTLLWACEIKLEVGPEDYTASLLGQIEFRQDTSVIFDENIVAMAATDDTAYLMQYSGVVELTLYEDPDTGNLELNDILPTFSLPLGLQLQDGERLDRTTLYWQVYPAVSSVAGTRMLYNSQTGDRLFLYRDGMSAVLKQTKEVPNVIPPGEGLVFYPPETELTTDSMGPWRVGIRPDEVRVYDESYDEFNSLTYARLIDPDGYIPILASTDANNVYVLFESYPPQNTYPYFTHSIRSWDLEDILFDYTVTPSGLIELHPEDAPGWEALQETLFPPIAMEISATRILLRYPTDTFSTPPNSVAAIYDTEGNLDYVLPVGSSLLHNSTTQLVRCTGNTVSIMRWR